MTAEATLPSSTMRSRPSSPKSLHPHSYTRTTYSRSCLLHIQHPVAQCRSQYRSPVSAIARLLYTRAPPCPPKSSYPNILPYHHPFAATTPRNSPCSRSTIRINFRVATALHDMRQRKPMLAVGYLATYATPCPVILIGSPKYLSVALLREEPTLPEGSRPCIRGAAAGTQGCLASSLGVPGGSVSRDPGSQIRGITSSGQSEGHAQLLCARRNLNKAAGTPPAQDPKAAITEACRYTTACLPAGQCRRRKLACIA